MTNPLLDRTCAPCRGGVPSLTRDEVRTLLAWTPEWQLMSDPPRIEREWRFGTFGEAFAFVQDVARLADEQGHHPDIGFGWAYARLSIHTHAIGGLHVNDFILASKVDALRAEPGSGAWP